FDVFGQQVSELTVTSEKTVWHTDEVENGVYFYRAEIKGEVISGKVVIQK
ncbi:MAG: T9SS type A sorting domain-containing protein, partial [Chlorobi bacterium]|nr:T9SS type A sorting domain-containing protein [Chlorobiota bacterium]